MLLNIFLPDAEERRELLMRSLLRELHESDIVEQIGIIETNVPDGAKGAWIDWLKVTLTPQNVEKVFIFIRDRLPGQPVIEMELEIDNKKLKLRVSKREDFLLVMKQAQKFIDE